MLHFHHGIFTFPPDAQGKLSSVPGCEVVLDGILRQRLKNQAGNHNIHHGLVDLLIHLKAFPQPFPDNIEVSIHIAELFPKGDTAAPVPGECAVHQDREGFNHGTDTVILREACLPVDDLKSIVEKMRVDLRLQCLHPGLLQCLLFLIGALKLIFQLCRHRVEMLEKRFKLPAVSSLGDGVSPFPVLQAFISINKNVNRLCNVPAEQQKHHKKQRDGKKRHVNTCHANLRSSPPEIKRCNLRRQAEGMAGNRIRESLLRRLGLIFICRAEFSRI